jgi:PPOX class probable F420-dependent enzyme
MSVDLPTFARLAAAENALCVVNTTRADGSIQSSVVSSGVMTHPVTGAQVVALVAVGGSQKLANLRARSRTSVVARSSFEWATVEGDADLVGPDDARSGYDADAIRLLLREVFVAAGGTHDDWEEYDRVMATERRTAVFVTPIRTYGVTRD